MTLESLWYSYILLISNNLFQLTAIRPTSNIVLHAQDFTIAKEKISLRNNNDLYQVTRVDLNDTFNFLTLEVDRELKEGDVYKLTIPFSGNLKQGLDGVYISSYVDKNTKKKEWVDYINILIFFGFYIDSKIKKNLFIAHLYG